MISAFGVDHGEISKAAGTTKSPDQPSKGRASFGRHATAQLVPTFHGAVAGRKGKKLKAAGTELGSGTAGGFAGGLIGAGIGAAVSRGNSTGAKVGSALGGMTGARTALGFGVNHANKKGYYKKQTG